jgi:hypothetical protein
MKTRAYNNLFIICSNYLSGDEVKGCFCPHSGDNNIASYTITSTIMPSTDKATVREVREKITEIQRTLAAMEYVSSGTLLKRTKVCGNPQCRCAKEPAARHGPYYEWSYLKAGKLRHRTLTPEQAKLMRLAIANYRKAKKLLRAWEDQTQHLIELNAPA